MGVLWRGVLVNVHCLLHIVRLCTGDASMILFTSKRVVTHFKIYMKDGYLPSDASNVLRPEECQTLCNTVVNAKHFMNKYHEKYYTTHEEAQLRFNPDRYSEFSGSEVKVQTCLTIQRHCRRRVKCLQCANSENIIWSVAFSQLHPFMYLLERRADITNAVFHTVGLIEPSAIIDDDKASLYFYHMATRRKSTMEAICRIGVEDRLRTCGAVFNTLNEENTMQTNFLKVHRQCRRSIVQGKRFSTKIDVLPCTVDDQSVELPFKQLFLVADPQEEGAVFILWHKTKERVGNVMVLSIFGRATQVGALLHPIPVNFKPRKKIEQKTRGESSGENKKKRKISEILRSDTDDLVEEESSSRMAVAVEECEDGSAHEEVGTKDTSTSEEYEEESAKTTQLEADTEDASSWTGEHEEEFDSDGEDKEK